MTTDSKSLERFFISNGINKDLVEEKYKDYDFSKESNFIKGCLHNIGVFNYERDHVKAYYYFWKSCYQDKNDNASYVMGIIHFKKHDYENAFYYFNNIQKVIMGER